MTKSLKDKGIEEFDSEVGEGIGEYTGNIIYYKEDVQEAVLEKNKVTLGRIESLNQFTEKDLENAKDMMGIKNWLIGILEGDLQDSKEIFGDWEEQEE